MYILFLLVHIFFATLSYYSGSIVVASLFVILGVISFFWFSPFRFSKKNVQGSGEEILEGANALSKNIKSGIVSFFRYSALTVSLLLFHISLFLGIYSLSDVLPFTLDSFILFGAGFVSLLYFGAKKLGNPRIIKFLTINHSLYTFFLFIELLFQFSEISLFYNNIIGLVALSWIYAAWNPLPFLEKKDLYLSVFLGISLFLLFLSKIIFGLSPEDFIFVFAIVVSIFTIILFEITSLSGFIKIRNIVRMLSLFLSYISLIFLGYYSIIGYLFSIPALLIQLFFHIYVHRKYENYPSLLFSSVVPIFVYLFFFSLPNSFVFAIIHAFCIFLVLTFLGRLIRTGYRYDEYVFQTVATGTITIFIGIYVFRFGELSLLQISGILLLFSISFFISYFQIRK